MQKRTLEELINTVDPAWPLVQEWIATARNTVAARRGHLRGEGAHPVRGGKSVSSGSRSSAQPIYSGGEPLVDHDAS